MTADMPNFDTLLELAKNNPDELDRLQYELTEELIQSAPARLHKRLRGLQFQVNAARSTSQTPLNACIRISRMMHESFEELREALNTLRDNNPVNFNAYRPNSVIAPALTPAKIIQFPTTNSVQKAN